jgi:hypothetical protein
MEMLKSYLALNKDVSRNKKLTLTGFGGNRNPVDFSSLPPNFAPFFQTLDSLKYEWETIEPLDEDQKVYGSLNILQPKDILGDWQGVVYFDDAGADNPIRNFKPVDFYSPENCVGYFHDENKVDMMYLLTMGENETECLYINFAGYVELLFMSRGFLHWPYVLLGLQGKDDLGVTEKFKTYMPELFPTFKWEEFVALYEKVKIK